MLLRAITLCDELIQFKLSDCPVYVTDSILALVGLGKSNLILEKTIMRGDPGTMIFEGDVVYQDSSYVGYIIYSNGFKLQKSDGTLKDFNLDEHIRIEVGNMDSMKEVFSNSNRTPLLFKCDGYVIQMSVFLFKKENGRIAVSGKSYNGDSLNPEDIQFYAGCDKDNQRYFYGDVLDGGVITLHNFKPCLIRDGSIEEVLQ